MIKIEKILVIKKGALGDVLRTTCLLHTLKDKHITWLTKENAIPLLENNHLIHELVTPATFQTKEFDIVINLDDDTEASQLTSELKPKKIFGAYYEDRRVKYTESMWFDMGLLSKHGIEKADEIKKENIYPYQYHIFQLIGKEFKGEEYILNYPRKNVPLTKVGIERRTDSRWQMKKWDKYFKLADLLDKHSDIELRFFDFRKGLNQYIEDINECGLIVTGDTLCLHIALALGKRVIAIFGPTPHTEVYDYGRLTKVIPKSSCKRFMRSTCNESNCCMKSITAEEVYEKVMEIIKNK